MPPLEIDLSSRFKRGARLLPAEKRRQVAEAITTLAGTFGNPHVHNGLGIRRLKGPYFECRSGRDHRIVFKLEDHTALLLLVGNHEDVKRLMKG